MLDSRYLLLPSNVGEINFPCMMFYEEPSSRIILQLDYQGYKVLKNMTLSVIEDDIFDTVDNGEDLPNTLSTL